MKTMMKMILNMFILVAAVVLPIVVFIWKVSPILQIRLATISTYSVALALSVFYIQVIGLGIGRYSGLLYNTTILMSKLATIVLIYSGAFYQCQIAYIQDIGSAIDLYSGLHQVTTMTQHLDMNLLSLDNLDYTICCSLIGISIKNTNYFLKIKKCFISLILSLIFIYFIINTLPLYPGFFDLIIHLFSQDYTLVQDQVISHVNTVVRVPTGEINDNVVMNPPAWWAFGVPTGVTVVGTALAVFINSEYLPYFSIKQRILAGLGSAGVTVTHVVYNSALESPLGFAKFMWGFEEYRNTGTWPTLEEVTLSKTDAEIQAFVHEATKNENVDKSKVMDSINAGFAQDVDFPHFIPDNSNVSNLMDHLMELFFKYTMEIIKPVGIQGHLDDLIGQRMMIEILLLIMSISIIFLFIFFMFNIIFLFNKDKIKNKFNNKWITFYINYQTFFSRLSLIFVPILLFFSLMSLCHGLIWLISHPIPYGKLDIDLHQFISSKSSLFVFSILAHKPKLKPNHTNNLKSSLKCPAICSAVLN